MYFTRVSVSPNRKNYRIAIKDFKGKQIFGNPDMRKGVLEVNILEIGDQSATVLLPKGMEENTAQVDINSIYLN